MPKRILLANDLAGLGKVALTASLPLLASCQVETVLLPTVILSSHTGGFPKVFCEDYSHATAAFLEQWRAIDLPVSACLIGYCKSKETLDLLLHYTKERAIPLIVDPIMGDHGRYYTGFDEIYAGYMRDIASQATVLMPNLTEAAFLTGRPYLDAGYDKAAIADLLWQLAAIGARHIILTGLSFEKGRIGFAYLDVEQAQISYHMARRFDQHFFGTGDMVATLIAAAFVEGIPLIKAFPVILDFMDKSLYSTLSLEREVAYGVFFEPHLASLSQAFQHLKNGKEEKNEPKKIT